MNKINVCFLIIALLIGLLAGLTISDCFYKETQHNSSTITVRTVTKEVIKEIPVFIDQNDSEWQLFTVTGYSANDPQQGTTNVTYSGISTDNNLPIIAVDPLVIPLYSIVEIENLGIYIALDTGYKITGSKIDILFDTKYEATQFGTQNKRIRILKKGN